MSGDEVGGYLVRLIELVRVQREEQSQHARILHLRSELMGQQLRALTDYVMSMNDQEREALESVILDCIARAQKVATIFQVAVAKLEAKDERLDEILADLKRATGC